MCSLDLEGLIIVCFCVLQYYDNSENTFKYHWLHKSPQKRFLDEVFNFSRENDICLYAINQEMGGLDINMVLSVLQDWVQRHCDILII